MNLKEKKKIEIEASLKEAELIAADDFIVENTKGDLWSFLSQVRGNYYFTNSNLVFIGGLAGIDSFSIPYSSITDLKTCNVGGIIPIIPTGIKVTYTDKDGKICKKKCSVMKRKEWIAFLSERMNK